MAEMTILIHESFPVEKFGMDVFMSRCQRGIRILNQAFFPGGFSIKFHSIDNARNTIGDPCAEIRWHGKLVTKLFPDQNSDKCVLFFHLDSMRSVLWSTLWFGILKPRLLEMIDESIRELIQKHTKIHQMEIDFTRL